MRTIMLEQKQIKIYEYEFEKIVSHMIIYTYTTEIILMRFMKIDKKYAHFYRKLFCYELIG